MTGKVSDINKTLISALDKSQIKNWADCLDRRQVWNQKRPPWLEAIIHLVYPVLDPIAHMLITAMQTGASNYQSMALAITCLSEMWDAIPDCLYTVNMCLVEILPASIKPLADSVLIQILFCALYTKLLECSMSADANEPPVVTGRFFSLKRKFVIYYLLLSQKLTLISYREQKPQFVKFWLKIFVQ